MSRLRWPLLIFAVCLPLILLAAGYRLLWLSPASLAEPEPVPAGDFEIAWLNTTTGGAAWERFVAGVQQAKLRVPGLQVDAANAFPEQTTAVPEVVLSRPDRPAKLRIRWYKLSSQRKTADWVPILAARTPAPLAIIGGSSSDRAINLALALKSQKSWKGEGPIFLITAATAESVFLNDGESHGPAKLLGIYPGSTFRICFANRQMAEAMLDFVNQNPMLKSATIDRPAIFRVEWEDDPFSSDFIDQFDMVLPHTDGQKQRGSHSRIPFSVGSFATPNRMEAETAASILDELPANPAERSLLVIPTVAAPARRLLRTMCDADPALGRKIVALNGDGMGANAVLRDGEYLWPMQSLPVPLVLFAHANPVAWNDDLPGPTSTDDVLHAAEMIRVLATAVYEPSTVSGADELAKRLNSFDPPYFDSDGNRLGDTGQYIVFVKPKTAQSAAAAEVWTHRDRRWELVKTVPLKRGGE